VMWNDPEHWPNSNVRWGFAANNLTHSSLASSHTYAIDDMCGAPANDPKSWVDPGWMYDAEMNIAPGSLSQIVFYDFGNATHRSLVHSFTWGPKSQSSTSFIAYGDMGTGSDRDKNSTAEILSHLEGVDVVVHVGDISYAMGHGSKWEQWFNEIEPVSTQVPYHVVLGNHEFDWPGQSFKPLAFSYMKDSGGECGIPHDKRFHMPGPRFKTPGDFLTGSPNIYHSFEVGPDGFGVHFSLISSEHDMMKGSEQYDWLAADLAAVNRTKTPWLVFAQHRPYYGTTIVRILPEYGIMRRTLEPLLVQHHVDLVLTGHIHQYQRTCPMVDLRCNASGPVYMVVGTAGATTQVPWAPKPDWLVARSDQFGIPKFVANATHMHVRWFRDIDGTIGDEFYIMK